jgi:hypothetical protein
MPATDTAMLHQSKLLSPFSAWRVHVTVPRPPTRVRVPLLTLLFVPLFLFFVGGAGACGRSPLDLGRAPLLPVVDAASGVDLAAEPVAEVAPEVAPDVPPEVGPDLPVEMMPERAPDLVPDRALDLVPDLAMEKPPAQDAPPQPEAGPVCHPQPETCNGIDDDCDGKVDQDLPAIPCPGGGSRYCVSGRYSECPRRCEVCVPGSERECFTSFCTFWGTSACASDGRSFGACREAKPPVECEAVANKMKKSPELEQCCIDSGFCCLDEFDLDNDGDRTEMLGRCDAVMCTP